MSMCQTVRPPTHTATNKSDRLPDTRSCDTAIHIGSMQYIRAPKAQTPEDAMSFPIIHLGNATLFYRLLPRPDLG